MDNHTRHGQSLMELLIGMALGAIFIIGSAVIIVPSLQTNKQVTNIQIQAQLASGLLNNVEAWGTGNWNNILGLATGTANTYYLNTSSSPFVAASGTISSWNGYTYRSAITVTSNTSIASGTNANFPMLVSSALTSWEPTSLGGHIQNLTTAPNGGQEPADLIFTSDSGCTTPLNFETESYTSSTGALVDWVNVPSLSAGSVIYACYGNSAVTTDQSHPSSTWNANYVSVLHLSGNANDSTANANNGTWNGTQAGSNTYYSSGNIGTYAGYFNGSNDYINLPKALSTSLFNGQAFTVSGWVNQAVIKQDEGLLGVCSSQSNNNCLHLAIRNGEPYFGFFGDDIGGGSAGAINTWYYLTFVYAGSSAENKYLYLNGNLVASGVASGALSTAGAIPQIGTSYDYTSLLMEGLIEEVNLLNTPLSPSWILTEYNNQSSPSTFYTIGAPATNTSGGAGIQSIVVNGVTYQRYFYLTDVYRDSNGNPTTVALGNLYDPSTKEVTVVANAASSTAAPTVYSMFITNNASNVFNQTSWSGGGGYSNAATFVSSTFSNSTNTTVNSQGAFELSGGTGNSCVY
jgi:hypothetical protein